MPLRSKATGCLPLGLVEKVNLVLNMQRLSPESVNISENSD